MLLHVSVRDHHQGARTWVRLKLQLLKMFGKNTSLWTSSGVAAAMFCILLFNCLSYVFLLYSCIVIVIYALLCISCYYHANWHSSSTPTEVFPCFFLSCKTNVRV
jgi:4-hydroxybenzoate polyprenyltransferase